MGIVNNGTQLIPISVARHGAISSKDEVRCSTLEHLIDSLLGFLDTTFANDTQALETAKYRTIETLLCFLQVKRRTIGEFQGHIDDAGRIVGIGVECLSILIRCAIIADVENIDQTDLIGYFRYMLVPLAYSRRCGGNKRTKNCG